MEQASNNPDLPKKILRAYRGGPELREWCVAIEVVTPIFGGSYRPRACDEIDVIRVPSVRGQLRFWWRALYAPECKSAAELYERESSLWGRAAADVGGRSAVEIRVCVNRKKQPDESDIDLQKTAGAYALWPARAESASKEKECKSAAPCRKPGTKFQLTLKVAGTEKDVTEVKNALRAWILFGGYGGRTRRGLGSLRVVGDSEEMKHWMPTEATRAALSRLFGLDIFRSPELQCCDVPWLAGASLHVAPRRNAKNNAEKAWTEALGWLKEFRQGTEDRKQLGRAREPGKMRPSISNWPEADKIRQLTGETRSHEPRHNKVPVWPRAGFGLPINGRFQTKGPNGESYTEPGPFELHWRAGTDEHKHDRLASPLIVKALPLADGTFVPCALWLNRAYPRDGQVVVYVNKKIVPHSQAPFDKLVADGDQPKFRALENKTSLRQAFLDWLHEVHKTTVVAP
jgi:CRISPR-associated protein Cmr1